MHQGAALARTTFRAHASATLLLVMVEYVTAGVSPSHGTSSPEHGRDGPAQDGQVAAQAPRPDIVRVHLHAFWVAGVAASAHLPQAGQTRSNLVIEGDV